MTKLKKEFKDFHDHIKITTEANVLMEKRSILQSDFEDHFPGICSEHGIELTKSNLRFIDQGSYKLNTTISNKDGAVDRDVAVIFPLDINEHSDPRKLKQYARDALKIENVRFPDIKEPCVTVGYHKKEEEFVHLDFPMYAKHNDNLYLARGKEFSASYSWELADPDGLNDFFLKKLGESEQLRRIIRYLKKWKQEKYHNSTNKNEIPPSIALTLLACEYFIEKKDDNDYDDLTALYHVVNRIVDRFELIYDGEEVIKAQITYHLPTQPYSDVFYKMKNSDSYGILFYNRIKKASENLRDACNVEADHDAAKYVQKMLGDEFEVPEKVAIATTTTNRKEHNFG
ncbi:cyclic GMP-AMP synthase DncV-like nucleotidyltransferase [Anaerospora hongkongensis]|uniref:cyclic GMP-AMP synthase DncV-like nucleotidyltransferase n=1 Tax=Anaerospora hongkongensis TaxID=244830 RepID=UPI00289E148C|nr:hypothetical protein [Anaerospora hongkongensis]